MVVDAAVADRGTDENAVVVGGAMESDIDLEESVAEALVETIVCRQNIVRSKKKIELVQSDSDIICETIGAKPHNLFIVCIFLHKTIGYEGAIYAISN